MPLWIAGEVVFLAVAQDVVAALAPPEHMGSYFGLWGLSQGLAALLAPQLDTDFLIAMAIVGMSALFAASVRAPLTGIALIIEMTAVTTVTVPMLLAAGAAVVTAMLVKSPPVYDSLREAFLRSHPTTPPPPT